MKEVTSTTKLIAVLAITVALVVIGILNLRAAGQSDLLGDTVDYGAVTRVVMGVVAGEHAELLEYLAERIAAAVLDVAAPIGPEVKVTVSVRKVRPPVPVDMASAGVRITRP